MKTKLLLALAPLVAFLATAAHAAPLPSQSEFLQSLAAPAACATDPAAVSGVPAMEPKVNTVGCLFRFCQSSADCPCSRGAGSCIGGTCHYPPPNTGGGGGGGGTTPACPGAFCTSDDQCLANCPSGPNSFCGASGTCVYQF